MIAVAWDDATERGIGATETPARRKGGRRYGLAFVMTGVVVGVVMATVAAIRDPLLPLDTVRFKGELAHVSESNLRAAVSPHVEGSWIAADVAATRRAVEALAWVKSAAIRRVWPDALRIRVTEHDAVARWGDGGVISARGVLFQPPQRPSALPQLNGPEGTAEKVAEAYESISARLGEAGLDLTALELDDRRSWRGRLAGGTVVIIGRDARSERVDRLAAAWPGISRSAEAAARVDLRYPNGFAIRWEAANQTEAPEGAQR